MRRYANLDHAASAPCFVAVKEAVNALLPWYSSVHRGAGFPSRVATAAYEGARDAVLEFVGARAGDTVVFTRHTTEAINVLANALPEDAGVVVFATEHHANLLPWLRGRRPSCRCRRARRRSSTCSTTRSWRRGAGSDSSR